MENKNDILEELKQLSPLLAEREKLNLFSVPEYYFNAVEEGVMEKIAAQSVNRELENSSLSKMKKQDAFDVPYGYFERLPEQILNKTSRKKNSLPGILKSLSFGDGFRMRLAFASAPALAVIILSIIFLSQPSAVIETNSNVAQVSTEEISRYLSDNVSSLDETAIANQLDDEALKNLSASVAIPVSETDIELQDLQNIDLSEIQNL